MSRDKPNNRQARQPRQRNGRERATIRQPSACHDGAEHLERWNPEKGLYVCQACGAEFTTLEDLAEGVVSITIVVHQEMFDQWMLELAQSMGVPASLLYPPKDEP